MGIVPITIFPATPAEADNPKLLAATDIVRSAAAVLKRIDQVFRDHRLDRLGPNNL